MATSRQILKPLVYALRSVLGVNGLASGVRELGAGLAGIEAEIRAVSARSRFVEESAFERHAQLMARFHTTHGIIPDYEHILRTTTAASSRGGQRSSMWEPMRDATRLCLPIW